MPPNGEVYNSKSCASLGFSKVDPTSLKLIGVSEDKFLYLNSIWTKNPEQQSSGSYDCPLGEYSFSGKSGCPTTTSITDNYSNWTIPMLKKAINYCKASGACPGS